jgi:hypothetical protein
MTDIDHTRRDTRDEERTAGVPEEPVNGTSYGDRPASGDPAEARYATDDGVDAGTDGAGYASGVGTDEEVLTRDPDAGLAAETRAAGDQEARQSWAGASGTVGFDVTPGADNATAEDGYAAAPTGEDGYAATGRETRPDAAGNGNVALVEEPDELMVRWQEVQTGFVDDPREALRTADELVQQVMRQVEDQFAAERSGMEQQWSRGEDVSTEDLRLLLQRYRSFFNRLLHV